MFRLRTLIMMAAVLLAAGATSAEAAFKVRITDLSGGGGTVTATDNVLLASDGGPGDLNPITGLLTFVRPSGVFMFGSYTVSLTGTSKPFGMNDATHAELDLNSISILNTGGTPGRLRIELTDTDFNLATSGTAGMISSIGGTINNAAGSVDVAAQTVDLGNGEFTQPGAGTLTLFNAPPPFVGPGHFGNTKTGNFAYAGGNFSLSEEVDMTLGVGTLISFDFDSQVVTPAPAGFILAATGLLPLMGGFWLRRKKLVVA